MTTASFTKKGRNKPNQDSILSISLDGRHLIAIADGMGGKAGGEIASTTAVEVIAAEFKRSPSITIQELFHAAHDGLIKKSQNNAELAEMGTTLSICIVEKDNVKIGHVGDTRIYHLRNDGILTRTKDQTELQHLLDEGVITKRKAKNYKRKNILLSVLTPSKDYELFLTEFNLIKDDRLMLCSDGFYSLVSKLEARDISVTSETVETLSTELLNLVESRDIHDDYSLITYQH